MTATANQKPSDEAQREAELLACPFCGKQPTLKTGGNMRLLAIVSQVTCETEMCGIRSPLFGEEHEAVTWWNTRHANDQAHARQNNP